MTSSILRTAQKVINAAMFSPAQAVPLCAALPENTNVLLLVLMNVVTQFQAAALLFFSPSALSKGRESIQRGF